MRIRAGVKSWQIREFTIAALGVFLFRDELCVFIDFEIYEEILREAHNSLYTIHLVGTKIYKDLKVHDWWDRMKRDIGRFVTRCLTFMSLLKSESLGTHLRPRKQREPSEWIKKSPTLPCSTSARIF